MGGIGSGNTGSGYGFVSPFVAGASIFDKGASSGISSGVAPAVTFTNVASANRIVAAARTLGLPTNLDISFPLLEIRSVRFFGVAYRWASCVASTGAGAAVMLLPAGAKESL